MENCGKLKMECDQVYGQTDNINRIIKHFFIVKRV